MKFAFRSKTKYSLSFLKHDFKSSISVYFVALPLCLGISLASGAPVYTGLIAGIVGGLVISLLSKSQLSVSGPAAGLTAICATAITELDAIEIFFLSVSIAGLMQILLGVFRLGGFTHFIPSSVIKGMLAAIGIILISKQIPILIGYDQPDFWQEELFNVLAIHSGFEHFTGLFERTSLGVILTSSLSMAFLLLWEASFSKKTSFLPTSFIIVLIGSLTAFVFNTFTRELAFSTEQYVSIPFDIYIDNDILEIFHDFKTKAKSRHIQLMTYGVPEVETIGLH